MTVQLVTGIGAFVAGFLVVVYGIQYKEFGFGNTLILTGTIGACTGMLMISLAMAVRELKKFAPQPEAAESAAPRLPKRELQLPAHEDHADDDRSPAADRPLFSRDKPAAAQAGADVGTPPPWQEEALRDRARGAAAAATPAAKPEEPKRRNLLFSSTRRERAEAAAAAEQEAAAPAAESAAPTPPKSFEDAWPQTERPRSEAIRRAARAPSTFKEANEATKEPHEAASDEQLIPERYVPPAPAAAAVAADAVTVLKSGVVDGMAYSLYSDGSIEAQMPEGMMRFASIDELREHLDQRG
ncbi:hypothetical protein V1281_000574 [Nitrobacteraceae bacterium AZCC 2161]|jgi:hypothetical protein